MNLRKIYKVRLEKRRRRKQNAEGHTVLEAVVGVNVEELDVKPVKSRIESNNIRRWKKQFRL